MYDAGFHPEGIILGGEAPGNGCGFIYFSVQLPQILGGGGGGGGRGEASPPPDETLHVPQFSLANII